MYRPVVRQSTGAVTAVEKMAIIGAARVLKSEAPRLFSLGWEVLDAYDDEAEEWFGAHLFKRYAP